MGRPFSDAQEDAGIQSLSMESFPFNTSPCGRLVKFEFLLNEKTARRFSRVGGVIQLGMRFFALTTAHALILPISEPSVRGSTSWQQSLNAADNPGDTDPASSEESDDDLQWCEQSPLSSAAPADITDEDSFNTESLSTTANFQEVDSKIWWCFGRDRTPELQQSPREEECFPEHSYGFDWALFEISGTMINGATNFYYPAPHPAPGIQVINVVKETEISSGPVHVLFSSRQPARGHLDESIISMYNSGSIFLVRRIQLEYPTRASAAASGAWVVRDQNFLGIVVLVDNDMYSPYMISAAATVTHIREFHHGTEVTLPQPYVQRNYLSQGTPLSSNLGDADASISSMVSQIGELRQNPSSAPNTASSPSRSLNPHAQPWAKNETSRLLIGIIEGSVSDVQSHLLQGHLERNIQPRWSDIPLPEGRSLGACRLKYDEMLRTRYLRSPSYAGPLGSGPPLLASSIRTVSEHELPLPTNRSIKPRPSRSTDSPIPPTANGEPFTVLRPFAPLEPRGERPKKRGRPTKEEIEERDRLYALDGKVYEPKKRAMKKSRPSETPGSLFETLLTTSSVTDTPLMQDVEPEQETSSGKRRARRQREQFKVESSDRARSRSPQENSGDGRSTDAAQSPSDRLLARF